MANQHLIGTRVCLTLGLQILAIDIFIKYPNAITSCIKLKAVLR